MAAEKRHADGADRSLVLGVDIGGTSAKFGLVDREGRCLCAGAIPTGAGRPPGTFFENLCAAARRLRDECAPGRALAGVGIGAANANFYTGTIERSPNLGWDYVDVRAEIGRHLAIPVAVTNDANAAALGEMMFGAARGMRDFIVITLGTGLGSGIVANGSLVYGADGFAGEIGHTIVDPAGRVCACGRRGCLETYCSATGLCRTVQELICDTALDSELRSSSYRDLTARRVSEAAVRGDPLALAAFESCGDTLGLKLADAVAHVGPEAIILCGGMAAAGELILRPTREAMEKYLFPIYRDRVKILPSGLGETNTAVLGAGALIWNALGEA